jgi:uncharacterized protein (DUF433 family)
MIPRKPPTQAARANMRAAKAAQIEAAAARGADMLRRVQAGESVADIAADYGMSREGVYARLKAAGWVKAKKDKAPRPRAQGAREDGTRRSAAPGMQAPPSIRLTTFGTDYRAGIDADFDDMGHGW